MKINNKLRFNLILIILSFVLGIFICSYFANNQNSIKKQIKEIKETVNKNQKLINSQDSLIFELKRLNVQQEIKVNKIKDTLNILNINYQKQIYKFNNINQKNINELKNKIDSLKTQFPNIPIIN